MDSETEERYVSLRLAQSDIANVIDLLNRARTLSDTSIKTALVRYCIMEYAKPFKTSKGHFHKKFKPIDEESVFPGGNSDHKALIIERDERIAHRDITAICPQLHYRSELDIFLIAFKSSHLYDNMDELIVRMLAICDPILSYLTEQIKTLGVDFREQIMKRSASRFKKSRDQRED